MKELDRVLNKGRQAVRQKRVKGRSEREGNMNIMCSKEGETISL